MNFEPEQPSSSSDLSGAPLSQRAYDLARRYPKEDPWSHEEDAAAKHPAAHKVCLRCVYPQEPTPQSWFCPNCGSVTGDYANCMPFVYIYSMGELARRGVSGKPEKGFFKNLFLFVFFTAQYTYFAPIYWYWLIRKATGSPICDDTPPRFDIEHPQPAPTPSRIAPRVWLHATTLCAVVCAVLVTLFIVFTYVFPYSGAPVRSLPEMPLDESYYQSIQLRHQHFDKLSAELDAYLKNLTSFLNAEGGWFAAFTKSPETLKAGRVQIKELIDANKNIIAHLDAKVDELNELVASNTTDAPPTPNLRTITIFRDSLQHQKTETTKLRVEEVKNLSRMDHILALLEENPDKWTRQANGQITINEPMLRFKIQDLVTELYGSGTR